VPPEIFTQTPIEGHIIALCMKVQTAFASILVGTGLIKGAFFVALSAILIFQIAKMGFGRETPMAAVGKIVAHLLLMALGLAFLGRASPNVQMNSVATKSGWSQLRKVRNNPEFSDTLLRPSEGLYWYVQIHRAVSSVGNLLTDTISTAFSDPTLRDDPTFLVKQLAKSSLAAAGVAGTEAARNFDALIVDCSDTKNGKILRKMSSVREIFDTATPHCSDLWRTFERSVEGMSSSLMAGFDPGVMGEMKVRLMENLHVADPDKAVKNLLVANAMVNYMKSRAGFYDVNGTKNGEATFSDRSDRLLEDAAEGPIAHGYMNILDMFMDNAHGSALKAEAANRFNSISSLIPAARGWIHGIIAIAFVLAAAFLCFGKTKFMMAWLLALGTISLYKPVSILGYKITNYFTQKSALSDTLTNLQMDPLLLGGVKIIREEITQIQTVYLAFEIGCFGLFLVGAVAAFGPLTQLANRAGVAVMGNAAQTLHRATHAFSTMRRGAHTGVPNSSSPTEVNVNLGYSPATAAHNSVGGHWQTQGAGFASHPYATRAPSSWDTAENWSHAQNHHNSTPTNSGAERDSV
jgi:hypothetical protein